MVETKRAQLDCTVVKSSSEYLGFHLGPTAGESQWIGPMKKYATRVACINDMKLPLRLAVAKHDYYALPVQGYVAQLALPPKTFRFELSAILKALGFAGNSMTCETAFSMGALLGFTPTRPSVYMESCMIRSAFKTFAGIQEMHFELVGKARGSSCLSLAYQEMRPPGWDAPACCSNLFHASQFSG